MDNPYLPPAHTELVNDDTELGDEISVGTVDGVVKIRRHPRKYELVLNDQTATVPESKSFKKIIFIFGKTKLVKFLPLKKLFQVSNNDFDELMNFLGYKNYLRHEMKQTRGICIIMIIIFSIAILIPSDGESHVLHEEYGYIFVGLMYAIALIASLGKTYAIHYITRIAADGVFTSFLATEMFVHHRWWLGLFLFFMAFSLVGTVSKYKYYRSVASSGSLRVLL